MQSVPHYDDEREAAKYLQLYDITLSMSRPNCIVMLHDTCIRLHHHQYHSSRNLQVENQFPWNLSRPFKKYSQIVLALVWLYV